MSFERIYYIEMSFKNYKLRLETSFINMFMKKKKPGQTKFSYLFLKKNKRDYFLFSIFLSHYHPSYIYSSTLLTPTYFYKII